jgi:hypothetical protein
MYRVLYQFSYRVRNKCFTKNKNKCSQYLPAHSKKKCAGYKKPHRAQKDHFFDFLGENRCNGNKERIAGHTSHTKIPNANTE